MSAFQIGMIITCCTVSICATIIVCSVRVIEAIEKLPGWKDPDKGGD
jgi:hypothetical protein